MHSGIVGMRWPEEIDRNIASLTNWEPSKDIAGMPRWTFEFYKAQDAQ